ncbi:MAG TPA: polymer-forming cytoskeletal protein [Verrucomicrobiae bacterium]|nr:polymer-forming cytoskeletal protein [Verrucomicrobiae bacterium]
MFSKNQGEKGNASTVFGESCSIRGTVQTKGLTRIDGSVEGDLSVDGDLVIGEHAKITANITGKNITVAGQVKGDIVALESLELSATAKLNGNIKTASFKVYPGAVFVGSSSLLDQGAKEAAAAKE